MCIRDRPNASKSGVSICLVDLIKYIMGLQVRPLGTSRPRCQYTLSHYPCNRLLVFAYSAQDIVTLVVSDALKNYEGI